MQNQIESNVPLNDSPKWIYTLGYSMLAFSLVSFVAVDYSGVREYEVNFTVFFIHYFLALIYGAVLINAGHLGVRKSWYKTHIHYTIVLLNLFLISAYALNRQMPVFEDSADWFCVFLIVTASVTLSYRFFNSLPKWCNTLQQIILGSAVMLYLYLSIYAANFYPIGSIAIIAMGIGAHIFVPIFLLIGATALMYHSDNKKRSYYGVGLGSVLVIIVTVLFVMEWTSRISAMERRVNQSVLDSDKELPVWVEIGQSVDNDWITERILKSNLVYTISNKDFQWHSFRSNSRWDEAKRHDPLVFIASLIKKSSLSDEIRIKILQSISDNRHRTQERLWRGDNLTTSYVVSDVDIYTDLRLAYTEKYLNIRNNAEHRRWWGSTEEAIYTFQLPEGSVATSLSLWINGNEEKSILTSKQKAANAYTTIVGKEFRDPSVLHWQEGNTVSVRIFPCTEKEERKFKIGITSPLPEVDGKIVYRNIAFRGPNPSNAKETIRVRFKGEPANLKVPDDFVKNIKGEYFLEHEYDPELSLTFSSTPVKRNQFSFDGVSYSMASYVPKLQKVQFSKIYLDINNSWNQAETTALRYFIYDHEAYVYFENEFVRLQNDNWAVLTANLRKRNFSLFPFHRVKDPARALVISKGKELSPQLSDFKESLFAQRLSDYFSQNNKIKLYNLTGGTSTYVSAFREFRGLEFAAGGIGQLVALLQKNQFPLSEESDSKIILHDSQMVIQKTKSDSSLKDNAPDHLARLFAYNDIMRKGGVNYFKDDYIDEALVDEAATAYVVSPVSSLIVLENKLDYDRFGIKDKENSIHNASMQSSGAVPEPHEWALILLFAVLIIYTVIKRYKFKLQY